MLGAIAGDIIGSPYEGRPIKTTDFPLFTRHSVFTDDTVLTIAVAHSILHGTDYATSLAIYGRQYPSAGYGGSKTAEVTHNHPEGIKGAQATALAVFLACQGVSKDGIKREIAERFSYHLDRSLSEIRPTYRFDVSCQGSVPESIIAFMESANFEDAVRKAISLGGDSDTMACIAGAVAQAFYKDVPAEISSAVTARLPEQFLAVIDEFSARFGL